MGREWMGAGQNLRGRSEGTLRGLEPSSRRADRRGEGVLGGNLGLASRPRFKPSARLQQ